MFNFQSSLGTVEQILVRLALLTLLLIALLRLVVPEVISLHNFIIGQTEKGNIDSAHR